MPSEAPPVADLAERLTGDAVRLFVYSRGLYPRDTLSLLWHYVEAEAAADKLFHGQIVPGADPYSWRGDLTEFVRYFDAPGQRVLLIAQDRASNEIAGLVWFDDLLPHYRAAVNVFYRRRFWGARARQATALAVRYGFSELGVQTLWGYTPWWPAVRHAEAVGFRQVACLPGFALIDGQPTDVTILRLAREEVVE